MRSLVCVFVERKAGNVIRELSAKQLANRAAVWQLALLASIRCAHGRLNFVELVNHYHKQNDDYDLKQTVERNHCAILRIVRDVKA
jgi:hypothetical protein